MYSLINQRDNRIAIETARGIRQIAESQQHDNAIMRIMAEDSNEIARLTRRDSSDMRTIAALTLIFLPARFIAVWHF